MRPPPPPPFKISTPCRNDQLLIEAVYLEIRKSKKEYDFKYSMHKTHNNNTQLFVLDLQTDLGTISEQYFHGKYLQNF